MPYSSLSYNDEPMKSILIVDDDEMIVELLALGFQGIGFKVLKAENGLDAWNLFNREDIDFVLTDLQMPGMNGTELSHRIRNQSTSTTIAVMSGGETNAASELLRDRVADYFFPKPFSIKTICEVFAAEAQDA
jgi:DNA-binding response OmpR family regulator